MCSNYFAEVIESSLDGWIAQSWQWDNFPIFGSTVIVENNERKLFGIVHQIQTGSIDSNRQPFAYQKTETELLNEQPQIFEFLKTTFSCLMLGYQESDFTYHILAPYPPKIHSFISSATKKEYSGFFKNYEYLQILFAHAHKIYNLDELLLAHLINLQKLNLYTENQFNEFIEKYSQLINNDYRKLKLFLQRFNSI